MTNIYFKNSGIEIKKKSDNCLICNFIVYGLNQKINKNSRITHKKAFKLINRKDSIVVDLKSCIKIFIKDIMIFYIYN